jgi:uncharacterized membrane protein YhaH (DUF805 family)
MNFQTAIQTCYRKYATFSGVAGAGEYWWFQLYYIIGVVVLSSVSNGLYLLWVLINIIPIWAAAIRRLHDTGKSGWWVLFPLVNVIMLCQSTVISGNKYR